MKLENEEDEESYRMFRIREKKIQLYDYADEKLDNNFTEECCQMVLQQRLLMINWIVEVIGILNSPLKSQHTFLPLYFLARSP